MEVLKKRTSRKDAKEIETHAMGPPPPPLPPGTGSRAETPAPTVRWSRSSGKHPLGPEERDRPRV